MPNPPLDLRNIVLGAHLILTGYGHWLPNDPRGSGSESVRKPELRELGAAHFGRKSVQPAREEVKSFYRRAESRLEHATIWFGATLRDAIGHGIGQTARSRGYTIWGCAVLRNHVHVIIRTHRDRAERMLEHFSIATREALVERELVRADHPVWSERPYKVYLKTPQQVRTCIEYVKRNPRKEGLTDQFWDFVCPFVSRLK